MLRLPELFTEAGSSATAAASGVTEARMALLLASTLAREGADPVAEEAAAGELAAELPLAAELLLDVELLHAARTTATAALPSTPATRLGRIEDPITPPLDFSFGMSQPSRCGHPKR
jgi:hypothetical protein